MQATELTLITFFAAAVLCAAGTPLAARVAMSTGVVAPVRADRWGQRRMPLLGGVAIVLAALLPVAFLSAANHRLAVVALGMLGALLLGVVDDVRGLRPSSKIVGQVVIASGLVLGGVRAEIVEFPPASYVLTLLWVVAMMNALNLVDNMDGLAAGIAAIAAGVLVLMSPVEPLWMRLLAAALAGSCVGFLVHNFPPARVYMGDGGSFALGYLLATLGLLLTNAEASNVGLAVLGPVLVLGLPIFDTTLVALVRRVEGRSVSQGGRDHTSHRLAALGLEERAAVLVLYGVAAGLALLGLFLQSLGFALLPIVGLVLLGLILFGVFLAQSPDAAIPKETDAARSYLLGAGRTLIRFGGEIGLDVALATIALFSAFLIRFEGLPESAWIHLFIESAPIIIPVQLAAFLILGVYRTLWRFLAIPDLIVIARSTFVGTLAAGVLVFYLLQMTGQSRAVLLLDGILLTLFVAGSRTFLVWLRHWFAMRPRSGDRRVLIVGATERGETALRMLLRTTETSYHPAGFLDDDPGKLRRRISGVPVLGRLSQLGEVINRQRADLVILALEDAAARERVRQECVRLGVEVREMVPSL